MRVPNARLLPRMACATESTQEEAMRPGSYPLTPAHVRAHADWLCQQPPRLQDHAPPCPASILWTVLCSAASRMASRAATCKALLHAPSDTAVHDAVRATLAATPARQRRVNRA